MIDKRSDTAVDQSRIKLSPSLGNYLKAVHDFQAEKGYAGVTDIAGALQVAKPAVSAALKNLAQLGLIHHRAYEGVRLTEPGAQMARGISGKFAILSRFITEVLGVDEERAAADAALMEHHASGVTMDRLVDLIRFFEGADQKKALEAFREYRRECESDESCPECEFFCELSTQSSIESQEKTIPINIPAG